MLIMYLIIFEDGDIKKTEELTEDIYKATEDRLIDVIDIKNLKVLYSDRKWFDIADVNS